MTAFVGGRDLRTFPPEVRSASVQPLGGEAARALGNANALLRVRFAEGERLPPQLTLWPEDRPIVLRDDGQGGDERAADGTFTAAVPMNINAFVGSRARMARGAREGRLPELPVFRNREIVASVQPRALELREPQPEGAIDLLPSLSAALDPSAIDAERSLMIRDPLVVSDPLRTFDPCTGKGTPGGKWTFRYLMEQMANTPATGVDAPTFVRRWLGQWESDQQVNGWTVPNRASGMREKILRRWEFESGKPGAPLNLDRAPFRLLAIVNRIDLRQNLVFGPGSAGEGRFVFGLVTKGPGGQCQPEAMSIIFEYGVEASSFKELQAWGQQWADLSTLPMAARGAPGTLNPAYGAALEAITERFARANASPGKPNGSALNQLRTNEIALAGPWELREFQIADSDAGAHHLREVTVKQTPDLTLDQQNRLADYVNSQAAAIKEQQHIVPDDFPAGNHFLGGSSPVPTPGFFWEHAGSPGSTLIPDREARHQFSIATCSGCHAGETGTLFTHVKPDTRLGIAAELSPFLKGDPNSPDQNLHIPDPGNPGAEHTFNDLLRRQVDLAKVVNESFGDELAFEPLRMVH